MATLFLLSHRSGHGRDENETELDWSQEVGCQRFWGVLNRRKGSEAGEPSFLTSTCASQNQIDGGHGSDVVSIPRGHRRGDQLRHRSNCEKKVCSCCVSSKAPRSDRIDAVQTRRSHGKCVLTALGRYGVGKSTLCESWAVGLPPMLRQGSVFPEAVGNEMTRCYNDIIKHLYRQKLHHERMRESISPM